MWVPKWVIAVAGLLLAVGAALAGGDLALRAFDGALCGNELVSSDSLPGQRFKVIVFVRNCGATTTFGTHVSLAEQNTGLSNDDVGNILSIDASCCADPRSSVLPRNAPGGPLATARWTAPDTLAVAYARGVRIVRQALVQREIRVVYATIE